MATCYRHPKVETGVSCSNCGRPICTDCMTPTPVGMRCPDCASQRTPVHTMRTLTALGTQATRALIAINVVIFLASGQMTIASSTSGTSLFQKGELTGSFLGQGVAYGQWWRVVSGGFLHENILHIAMNMYVLWILGNMLEPAIGRNRFLTVYGVSLLTGSLGALIVDPHIYTVGASGAIFGVMGAAAVEVRGRGISIADSGIGAMIALNLVFSFAIPGISWGGHVGGLIGGAIMGWLLREGDRHRQRSLAYIGAAVLAVIGFGGSILVADATEQSAQSQAEQILLQQQQQQQPPQ